MIKHFTMYSLCSPVAVEEHENTTLNMVWASKKCWYMPGNMVLIVDEQGNMKAYVKEVSKKC